MTSTTLHDIYSKQSGAAAPVSAELVSNDGSNANTGTSTPIAGRTPRRRMILDPAEGPQLKSGASDTLGLGGVGRTPRTPGGSAPVLSGDAQEQLASGWKLVREFIHAQGDRTIHFSGEAGEVLGNLPVKRYLVVTENAIYRIPHSTVDTGIFFDCRVALDGILQLITQDAVGQISQEAQNTYDTTFLDAQVQCYLQESAEVSAKKSFVNDPLKGGSNAAVGSATGVPFFTLSFAMESTRRKAFLLAMCAARPTMSILQKRHVRDKAQPYNAKAGTVEKERKGRIRSPNTSEKPLKKSESMPQASPIVRRLHLDSKSPSRESPRWNGGTHSASRHMSIGNRGMDSGRKSTNSSRMSLTSPKSYASHSSPGGTQPSSYMDISDADFEAQKQLLRTVLGGNAAGDTGAYDAEKHMSRPVEEDESRQVERDKMKAELDSREAKMVQNIHFRVKYPQKVPTKVPPGVEFDKAHEERIQLPDDFSDEDLLGPSLFPLWDTWKRTGGLMGGDNGVPTDWTLFDSQDLIDSLNQCEEVLFGVVGKMSLRRVATMRELVDRERQMFLNKKSFHEREAANEEELLRELEGDDFSDASGAYSSPGSQRRRDRKSASRGRGVPQVNSRELTMIQPFRLSQSPTQLRKLKVIDSKKLVADMKQNFERHMRSMHELQKDQLENQLSRATD